MQPNRDELIPAAIIDAVKLRFRNMIKTVPVVPCNEATELILRFAIFRQTIDLICVESQKPGINALEEWVYNLCNQDLKEWIKENQHENEGIPEIPKEVESWLQTLEIWQRIRLAKELLTHAIEESEIPF